MDDNQIAINNSSSVTELLVLVGNCASIFLDTTLPKIQKTWWEDCVLSNLTDSQYSLVRQSIEKSTRILDLSALLRVLDKNWYAIADKYKYTREDLNYVKEMQVVRNRWAHQTVVGVKTEDIYRDLDTIKRFSKIVRGDDNFLTKVEERKKAVLLESIKPEISKEQKVPVSLQPGQMVALKSDRKIRGVVSAVIDSSAETKYKVFTQEGIKTLYESQLVLLQEEEDIELTDPDVFHACVTTLQILNPSAENLYSLNSAKIDFIPYQFRPVLKFLRADRPRILIADSVGVGKTIEAGLILKEIQSRREVNSILIICPRQLITEKKWQTEMRRFDESFVHIDGKILKFCVEETDTGGDWPDLYKKAIIPYSLFTDDIIFGSNRKKISKGLISLSPPPKFDLVIVDEAHHIRNTNTANYNAVRYFCDNAEAVVFLTATPVQLGNQDLFVLLNALRDDLIIDMESFTHMSEPNPSINTAVNFLRSGKAEWKTEAMRALDNASSTAWGISIIKNNPEFIDIMKQLKKESITVQERIDLINRVERLHTFSGIINRTRRRDIGDFTLRKSSTVSIEFTDNQKFIHDELLAIQMELFSITHSHVNLNFLMTTIRRQAASCIFGLAPFLKDMLDHKMEYLEYIDMEGNDFKIDNDYVNSLKGKIETLIDKASMLDCYDPKLEALCQILSDKQRLDNRRVILFSSFVCTLRYLHDSLVNRGFRVGLIYGGVPDEDRVSIRANFMAEGSGKDSIDILLFSEIGCEGLDYQFCDCLINYDIPWNPMRIEQRIGRIDRNGQQSEKVLIYNFITPGTIDAIIYERCFVRIGIFENTIGAGEEILGELTKEIRDIAENVKLSNGEKELKLQQLADNKVRLIKEQEELEQNQLDLFGIKIPKEQLSQEIADASSYWLSESSLKRLITNYIESYVGDNHDFLLGDKDIKTLRLSQETRNQLLEDYLSVGRVKNLVYKDWENWLKGANPHLQITFNPEKAKNGNKIMLISSQHPLVKQASVFFKKTTTLYTALRVETNIVPPGQYEFSLYQWKYSGIRDDTEVKILSSSEIVEKNYKDIFDNSHFAGKDYFITDLKEAVDRLDNRHHSLWLSSLEKHKTKTKDLARYKKESLQKSHQARIAVINEQVLKTTDDKIKKMKESQILNANADFERRLKEIEDATEKADIITNCIAQGIINVIKETK